MRAARTLAEGESHRETGTYGFRLFRGSWPPAVPEWAPLQEGTDYVVTQVGGGNSPYSDVLHFAIQFAQPLGGMAPVATSSVPLLGMRVEYKWRGATYVQTETTLCNPLQGGNEITIAAAATPTTPANPFLPFFLGGTTTNSSCRPVHGVATLEPGPTHCLHFPHCDVEIDPETGDWQAMYFR